MPWGPTHTITIHGREGCYEPIDGSYPPGKEEEPDDELFCVTDVMTCALVDEGDFMTVCSCGYVRPYIINERIVGVAAHAAGKNEPLKMVVPGV